MHQHHRIDYIEFPVSDLAAAKRFYGAAFGWEFTDYGDTYVGISGGPGAPEAGGFALTDHVTSGGPLVILFSDDLDASVSAVEAAGGEIVAGPYDFPGGRRFEFDDPDGHRLAVWAE